MGQNKKKYNLKKEEKKENTELKRSWAICHYHNEQKNRHMCI